MTKRETNLYKKGSRCRICTGCGRCFGEKKIDAVCEFVYPQSGADDRSGDMAQSTDATQNAGAPRHTDAVTGYLVAVDIGTTTIAMQLREMASGRVADSFTCINPQRSFGADVLSRIEAADSHSAKEEMRQQVQTVLYKGLEQFAEKLAGKATEQSVAGSSNSKKEIKGMAIAANTTMIHLLLGYPVDGLGKYPFTPQTVSEIRTNLCGMDTVILPGVSAFVGADVMAGVYALSMQEHGEITLLIDLGTNGEMVLGNKERMIATSTAAGPAFEGGRDYFGTDLVKQVAVLLEEGVLDETGLLIDPYFEEGILIGGVEITQSYIRQLQMAKSAICTGVRILCEKYGLRTIAEIDKVYLAGGMGYYLDVQAAVAIGLLPKQLETKTVAVGNSAIEGAFLYGRQVFGKQMPEEAALEKTTLEKAALEKAQSEKKGRQMVKLQKVEEFNLAAEQGFSDAYISGMDLKPCIE